MASRNEEASDAALAFEALLRQHGLSVAHGSVLERTILDVFAITYGLARDEAHSGTFARSLAGFGDLARLLLRVKDHPSFEALLPHLRMLNDGEVRQTTSSPASDQVANKLFELYVACLAMRCGMDVSLDDPCNSQGNNPDVIATFAETRWGIACKVLHGTHSQSILNLVASGLDQIDRSDVTTGLVIVNLKNRIDHNFYWPPTEFTDTGEARVPAFRTIEEPMEGLEYDTIQIGRQLRSHASESAIAEMFRGRKSLPGFTFWAQTTAMVVDGDRTMIVNPHLFNTQVFGRVSLHQQGVLECLSEGLGDDPQPGIGPRHPPIVRR